MSGVPRTVRIARAVHRWLSVLVPRAVRHTYREEMIATFETALAEASARGRTAVCVLLAREIKDLATARVANRPASVVMPGPASAGSSTRAPAHEWMDLSNWLQSWRSLRRRPAFLAAAVLTLGLGGGITIAVFALVNTVLVKPLPFPNGDDLVMVYESSPSGRERTSLLAPGRLEEWNRQNQTFVAISGSYSENVTDTSATEPERLDGRRVAPRFFAVFGMRPLVGRAFVDEEEQASGPAAAMISERFWTRRFARDPSAVGRALVIGGRSYQIVGVMPGAFIPGAFASATTDVWLPAQFSAFMMRQRNARFLTGVGRLRPGVTGQAGARDLAGVQAELGRQFPETDAGWSSETRPMKDARIGASRKGLVLVFGAVLTLWLIAVANIAGLTLVQVHRRARELAIRAALGASRARVVSTVIREGLLIAFIGGAVAMALAVWLVAAMPAVLSRTPRINELALDWLILGVGALTSVFAACVFSLVPALAGTRLGLTRVMAGMAGMAGGSRGVAGGRHQLQKVLVVAQVALSVLLVGSATLLIRSYYNLANVETGLDATNALTFHVGARWDEDRTRIRLLQQQLIVKLQQLPHVQAAGMTNFLPATGATLRYAVSVDGLTGPNADGTMTVGTRMISGGYLRAIRAPLLAGAWCPDPTTDLKVPLSAMVNQRFVDLFAPGQTLIGRQFRIAQTDPPFTIAGIIGNIAEDGHGTSAAPYAYTCVPGGAWPDPEYVVRTVDARAFATDLRRIVHELDPSRAIFGLRPVQDVLDAALDQPRLDAAMLGFFAGAAVTLAAVGLYSLFMLVVSERAREMAVRLAIGAAPRQVIGLVMSGAGRLLAGGIVLGIVLTAAADRVLRGVVFGVSPLDIRALAAAAVTLALVSLVAVAGPALKAARIAPIEALRGD